MAKKDGAAAALREARRQTKYTMWTYQHYSGNAELVATNVLSSMADKGIVWVRQYKDSHGMSYVHVFWKNRVRFGRVMKAIEEWNQLNPGNQMKLSPVDGCKPIVLPQKGETHFIDKIISAAEMRDDPKFNTYSLAGAADKEAAEERAMLEMHQREMNVNSEEEALSSSDDESSEEEYVEPTAAEAWARTKRARRSYSGNRQQRRRSSSPYCTEDQIEIARLRAALDSKDEMIRLKDEVLGMKDGRIAELAKAAEVAKTQLRDAEAANAELKQRLMRMEAELRSIDVEHGRTVAGLRVAAENTDARISAAVMATNRARDAELGQILVRNDAAMAELKAQHEVQMKGLQAEVFKAQQALDAVPPRMKMLEREVADCNESLRAAHANSEQVMCMLNERMLEARNMLIFTRTEPEKLEEIFYNGGFGRGELKFRAGPKFTRGRSSGGYLVDVEFVREPANKVGLWPIRGLIWQLKCLNDAHDGKLLLAQPGETRHEPDERYFARFAGQLKGPHEAGLMEIVRRVLFRVPEFSAYAHIPAVVKVCGEQFGALPRFSETVIGSYCGETYQQAV